MREKPIQQRVFLALGSRVDVRMFRNNIGVGTSVSGSTIRFGLHPGSGDLIGWKTVAITPEMIGHRVAVFTSIECKSDTGRARPDQIQWAEHVRNAGGIAAVVGSEAEAIQAIESTLL